MTASRSPKASPAERDRTRVEDFSKGSGASRPPGVDAWTSNSVYENHSFLSERELALKTGGDDSASEEDGVSPFPAEEVDAERPRARQELPENRRADDAPSFAPVKSSLWPLAVAVVAVLAVERVTLWKTQSIAPPTASATDSPTPGTTSPSVTVVAAPVDPGVAAQSDERTQADRVASLEPVPAEHAIVRAPRTQSPVQPAVNTRPAAIEGPPTSVGLAARAPTIEMLPPDMAAPATSETAAAPASVTPAPIDPQALDKAAIDRVLGVYRQSYSALDAAMVSTVWRGLDTRSLQRAFDGLNSQRMSFERCDVIVQDDKARASCTGILDYVRKIGQTNPLQKRLLWNFDLQRTDDRWLISRVDAR